MTAPANNITADKNAFFGADLAAADRDIFDRIGLELNSPAEPDRVIASENIVSRAVLEAQGSILTNKYAEGYPGKRYYAAANMSTRSRPSQSSGPRRCSARPSPMSSAFGLAGQPSRCSWRCCSGRHLPGHGPGGRRPPDPRQPANQSGKWFKPVSYSVRQQDQLIDYDAVEEVALREKPKLIIAGGSAYSRQIDFARFRQIADKIGAYLMVDMATSRAWWPARFSPARPARPCHHHHHPQDPARSARRHGADQRRSHHQEGQFGRVPRPAGRPAGARPSPQGRGFRRGAAAVVQVYAQQVIDNARALSEALQTQGVNIVSGGTDSHLMLVDLRPRA